MLTDETHNACKGLAYKLLHGNNLLVDYRPVNSSDVLIHSEFAKRFVMNLVEAHWAQIKSIRGEGEVPNLDSVIAELLHGNDANPFYSTYKGPLAIATMNWTSCLIAYRSMVLGGIEEEKAAPLLDRCYDVIPLTTYLLYSMLKLPEPERNYDFATHKAAEAHISLQGILNS